MRAPAGVRAQAVRRDGGLVDDFLLERHGRVVHLLNAPSPAATASLEIARHVVDLLWSDEARRRQAGTPTTLTSMLPRVALE